MIRFQYPVEQQTIEVRVSNWCGLEQVYLDDHCVSRKITCSQTSKHSLKLKSGDLAQCLLFVDPKTKALMCNIYHKRQLVTQLQQAKKEVSYYLLLQESAIVTALLGFLLLYLK